MKEIIGNLFLEYKQENISIVPKKKIHHSEESHNLFTYLIYKKFIVETPEYYIFIKNPDRYFKEEHGRIVRKDKLKKEYKKFWYALIDLRVKRKILERKLKDTKSFNHVDYQIYQSLYNQYVTDLYSLQETFSFTSNRFQIFLYFKNNISVFKELIKNNINPKRIKSAKFPKDTGVTKKMQKELIKKDKQDLINARNDSLKKTFKVRNPESLSQKHYDNWYNSLKKDFEAMGNFRNYIAHKQENDFKVKKRKFKIKSKEIVFKKHKEIEDKFSEISNILYGTAFLLEPIELSSLLDDYFNK